VWQEKVKVIVMLTNVVEGGKRKCEQYWPDQEPQEYGPFTVTLADQQVFADYIVRTLNVMVRPFSFYFQFTHAHISVLHDLPTAIIAPSPHTSMQRKEV